jgi:microcystin-dependent protein
LGAAIGSIYGGNGTTTFAVPPLVYHATSNPNIRYPAPSQSSGTTISNTGLHTHTVTPASPSSVASKSWTHTHATTTAATSNVTANHNHDGWSATISSVANSNQSTNRTASTGSAEYHNDVPHTHSAANSNLYLSANYPNTGANVTNNVNEGNNPTAATNAHSHTVNFHTDVTYSYSHNHSASYSGGAATTSTQSAIAYPLSKEAYFIIKC